MDEWLRANIKKLINTFLNFANTSKNRKERTFQKIDFRGPGLLNVNFQFPT